MYYFIFALSLYIPYHFDPFFNYFLKIQRYNVCLYFITIYYH